MFKKLVNQLKLKIKINVNSPLLIKSGHEGGIDPTLPDMQFVRTNAKIYIPGSSLKGVFRSHAEKIARTADVRCCNPFEENPSSPECFCGKLLKIKNQPEGAVIYKNSCLICRIFGSTAMASRIKFDDAFPESDIQTEVRTGVAIDRILGSVAHGPFDFEVVTSGSFNTQIHLRNFELWQLGLLGLVLRDIKEGFVPIGFGKSRGLGKVDIEVSEMEIRYLKNLNNYDPKTFIFGVGKLLKEEEREKYGFSQNDVIKLEAAVGKIEKKDFEVRVIFDNKALEEIFIKTAAQWKEKVINERSYKL